MTKEAHMDQPHIPAQSLTDAIRAQMAANGLPFLVAERISKHYLPIDAAKTVPTTTTPQEAPMSNVITLAGPLTRVLEKDERSPLNSTLSRAKKATLGGKPTVQTAIDRMAEVGVQVVVDGEKASSPRVQHYVPVDKTHVWKGQPVSKARFDHLVRMSGNTVPEGCGEASTTPIVLDEVDPPSPATTAYFAKIAAEQKPLDLGAPDIHAMVGTPGTDIAAVLAELTALLNN